jgi:hypothetical protein
MHHKYADVMVLEDIVQHLEQTHPAAQAAE